MRRIDFHLKDEDRKRLNDFRFAGRRLAREVTREAPRRWGRISKIDD